MKRFIIGLIGLAVILTGCSVFDFFADTSTENTHVVTSAYEGVIFTADNTQAAGIGYEFNDPIQAYWTPTEAQIDTLESGLTDYLKATIVPDNYAYKIIEDLSGYKRQYFGITFAGGQPLVYTNFFCVDEFDYWLESPVFVMDGGECFFQVTYNPATDLFSNLRVNGFA